MALPLACTVGLLPAYKVGLPLVYKVGRLLAYKVGLPLVLTARLLPVSIQELLRVSFLGLLACKVELPLA